MRVVIPTLNNNDLDAVISEHFGRAPYFALLEVGKNGVIFNIEFIKNTSEHFGGTGLPSDRIISLNPDALITCGMGSRAIDRFRNAKVAVLSAADNRKIGDLVHAFSEGSLEELTEGCKEARHQY